MAFGEYKVVVGIIVTPGKFEGSPEWAPYFDELVGDGGADQLEGDEECTTHVFNIDSSDVERFPSLEGVKQVRVWYDDNGFIHTRKE